MSNHIHRILIDAFTQGTRSVHSYTATLNHVTPSVTNHQIIQFSDIHDEKTDIDVSAYSNLLIVGAGKASISCVSALESIFNSYQSLRNICGTVISKHGFYHPNTTDQLIQHINIVTASHPISDHSTLQHTHTILQQLQSVEPRTLIIFVLTGGASSLFELPVDGVSLDDLIQFNQIMQRSGANILELNQLRQCISKVKSGRLLQYVQPDCTLITLVMSDVIGDNLNIIGSAPTYINPVSSTQRYHVNNTLHRYNLLSGSNKLPDSILHILKENQNKQIQPAIQPSNTYIKLIANNYNALQHAQHTIQQSTTQPIYTLIVTDRLSGDVSAVSEFITSIIESCIVNNQPCKLPCCLLFGGECTVQFNNTNYNTADCTSPPTQQHESTHYKGGRNQHLALLLSKQIQHLSGVTILCGSTDGNDHVDNIAGAIIDCNTYANAVQHIIDVDRYINTFDSYHFFVEYDRLTHSQSHVDIGITNTNVADIILVYIDTK